MRSSKTLEFCTSSYNILAVFAVEFEGNIPKADKRADDSFEGDTSYENWIFHPYSCWGDASDRTWIWNVVDYSKTHN